MEKPLGGALILSGVVDDYEAGFIDYDEVLRRIQLIKMFEANLLTLYGLCCIFD